LTDPLLSGSIWPYIYGIWRAGIRERKTMTHFKGNPQENQVFAIRYCHRPDAVRADNFYQVVERSEESMPMDYYIWLIRTPQGSIVFDTGFTEETARGINRQFIKSPLETLAEIGIDPLEVKTVILSHLHFDHTGNVHGFPNATFVVQSAEMEFWFGRHSGRGQFVILTRPQDLAYLAKANREGRVKIVEGDAHITEGISVHFTPGHTPGSQVVKVETAEGPLVLTSDASHYYANIEGDLPHRVIHTLPMVYDAFDRIKELAGSFDRVVPGHDPLVLKRFPAVDSSLEGMVHRLG